MKHLVGLFLLVYVCNFAIAQGSNCSTADPFCTDFVYTFPNSTNTVAESGPDYNCLTTQPNPSWYFLQIANSGDIEIYIEQTNLSGIPIDVDYMVWGPFSSPSQGCNNLTLSNSVSCSYDTSAQEIAYIPNAVSGEYYMFLLTNYNGDNGTITFAQTNGSGSTNCGLICGITGFTANPGACQIATSTYTLSGTLSISNPPTSGVLTISNNCGGSQTFNPPFSSNINYSFPGLSANGNSCTVSATFSLNPECNDVVTYTAPAPCNAPICSFTNINTIIGACETTTGTYTITGNVSFTNPPATGLLIITSSGGVQTIINAPFGTNQNFTISNIPADGSSNLIISAGFSATPACTINSLPFNEPTCPCSITNFSIVQGACNPTTNTYSLSGIVEFISPPSTGQLIVETCDGNQLTFNAPFTSPINYTFNGLNPNNASCDVTAYFSADVLCTISLVNIAPPPCTCSANAGTFTANITGDSQNNYVLCFGDQININSNNDFTYPEIEVNIAVGYNPSIWYLVYSCLPTLGPPNDVNNDACFVGVAEEAPTLNDINDLSFINSFPVGTFSNNTVYYVPVTMYDVTTSTYASVNNNVYCYDLGQVFTVTYLPEITTIITENCAAGTVSVTLNGGAPQIYGSTFTVSNLQPATANFSSTTIGNGGNVIINNLQNGDLYSFNVIDANGCPITVSGGPFVGGADINISSAGPFCLNDPAAQLNATPAGGTWSGLGVSASGLFNPAFSGSGNINVSYSVTTNCTVTESINVVVNPQGSAQINPVGTQCTANAPFQLTAASTGGTWSGNGITNSNTGTFSPIVAGAGTHTITYTIPGSCGDQQSTIITVIQSANATFAVGGPYCEDASNLNLISNSSGGTWSGTGIIDAVVGVFSPNAANIGLNTITYTIAGVCGDSESQNVIVQPTVNTTINPTGPYCIDAAPITLSAATLGGTWSGNGITNSNDGLFNPQTAGVGIHTISYEITGSCGTVSSIDIEVTAPPVIDFDITDSSGCVPFSFSLFNQSNPAGNNCTWKINDEIVSTSCFTFFTTLNDVGAYSVTLTSSSSIGCSATLTKDSFIVIYPDPIADFFYLPKDATFINPKINFTNTSKLANLYFWDIENGLFNSTLKDINYYFPNIEDTSYTVCLTAISENGCRDTTCDEVFIKSEFSVFVPKAFSPNNDGLNDGFRPILRGFDPENYEFTIFNRWGELLFESKTNDESWNGTKNGKFVQQDVYVWHLKVRPFPNGEKKELFGTVMSLKDE